MRVAILGARGQLGSDLVRVMKNQDLVALEQEDLDICNFQQAHNVLTKTRPDVVINTAALHRVDDCEDEKEKAFSVNTLGARNIAVISQSLGAKLLFVSTDHVFGGGYEERNRPYTEFDSPTPVNIYGKSKLEGEKFAQHLCSKYFIVRTSGLYGIAGSSGKGGNFVETMLRLGRERDELRVVNDQILSPTYTKDLASKIAQLIDTDHYGIFHITNRGSCSWYEFALEILRVAGIKTRIIPITSEKYPQKAKRPSYSVLDNFHLRLLGMNDMRPWPEALADYLREKENLR